MASIGRSGEVLMGNEDSLTSGDVDADYFNRDKFELESDPTLHAALDEWTREGYQKLRQQYTVYITKTHMNHWKKGS